MVNDGNSMLEHCPSTKEIEEVDQLNELDIDTDREDSDPDEERQSDSGKRSKRHDCKEKLKKHKDLLEHKIHKYYNGHFYGYPSSYSAYLMLRDMKRHSNEYLWYAIVGATSMYLDQKINKDAFDHLK